MGSITKYNALDQPYCLDPKLVKVQSCLAVTSDYYRTVPATELKLMSGLSPLDLYKMNRLLLGRVCGRSEKEVMAMPSQLPMLFSTKEHFVYTVCNIYNTAVKREHSNNMILMIVSPAK